MAEKRTHVSPEQILDLFATYSVLTADQIKDLIGARTIYGIRNQIKRMCGAENPLISSRNIARPWYNTHTNLAVFLTEHGAGKLQERLKSRIFAPQSTTLKTNFVHGMALSDIGVALHKEGLRFSLERRISIKEDCDEFIRPDILCEYNGKLYLIEVEQSRSEQELRGRLLGRLRRWQKTFTSPDMKGVSRDIIVLFSIKKDDQHTVATWMQTLNLLEQELGRPAAFTVWAMQLSEFLNAPTLDLRRFRMVQPSETPDSTLLEAEQNRFFDYEIANRLSESGMRLAFDQTTACFRVRRGEIQSLAYSDEERKMFLDQCDQMYTMAAEMDEWNGKVPWLEIFFVRRWLEQPIYAKLRGDLIESLEKLKSSYTRGSMNVSADALERMVWNVLLRRFGFAYGGPLLFHAQIGSSEKDRNPRSGLIPVFSISAPWENIRTTEEEAEKTCRSLTWLVNLLVNFQEELNLIRANKKAQSAAALDPINVPEEEPSDAIWEEPPSETL